MSRIAWDVAVKSACNSISYSFPVYTSTTKVGPHE
jgi:hypothetical protein